MKNNKPTSLLSDEELVHGILNNDETIISHFFFDRCTPLFLYIIRNIFDYRVDKNELINELYLYLHENDWYKLRQFDYHSKLTTWISVVAIRFFQKKRETLIENNTVNPLYTQEDTHNPYTQLTLKMDVAALLKQMPNERYRNVIQSLFFEDIEPERLANRMGITIDNLYNLKRRALQQLLDIVKKEKN